MRPQIGLLAGLLLATSACGAEPPCVIHGVTLMGLEGSHGQDLPKGWDCTRFSMAMEVVITKFDELRPQPGFVRAEFLKRIQGYSVNIRDAGTWYSPEHDGMVSGMTWCWNHYILVNKYPANQVDTLVHELAHVAQNCVPYDHSDWNQPGPVGGKTVSNTVYETYDEVRQAFWYLPD